MDQIPGSERSPGGENGNPHQYVCLGIPWTEDPGRLYSPWSCRESGTAQHAHMPPACCLEVTPVSRTFSCSPGPMATPSSRGISKSCGDVSKKEKKVQSLQQQSLLLARIAPTQQYPKSMRPSQSQKAERKLSPARAYLVLSQISV